MTFTEKYLEYNNGTGELPEGSLRISASQFNTFMGYPHQWYREQVLKEEGFTGNTSSVIGTIVHACAAAVANGDEVKLDEIETFIDTYSSSIKYPDVDTSEVRTHYKLMAETLINNYVLTANKFMVEEFVKHEILPDIFPSGSIDLVEGSKSSAMIVDYKTYNSKTKPKTIPMNYKYQLLIYAYILNKNGINADRMRLVYVNRLIDGGLSEKTGKPLKSYYPEVTVLTESITKEDLDFIESVLTLCAETYKKSKEDPSLVHLLYRDMRLKQEGDK